MSHFAKRAHQSSEHADPLDAAETIFIVEASDAVAALTAKLNEEGAPPGCAAIGFSAFDGKPGAWEPLKPHFHGKGVFIVPDESDEARQRAELIASFLWPSAGVAIVAAPGGDMGAFLASRDDLDDLSALCNRANAWKPEAPSTKRPDKPPPDEAGAQAHIDPDEPSTANRRRAAKLAQVIAIFNKWLVLKDAWPIYVTLGAVVANHLPGPPVWLGLIAPPSSAKTEILNALLRLSKVEMMTTASPAALLSGTPRNQRAPGAKGGLLRKIGSFGILVLKDFTSVLGLHKDNLSAMLDALREIYDGKWVRHLGTDGGKTLEWEGKLGLIFGCTEAYDSHYAIIGALGDRFLLYRMPPSHRDQFEMAMLHTGERFKLMQDELANAVTELFAEFSDPLPAPRTLTIGESLRIKKHVILACQLRAGVDRDRYSREIEAVYGAEGAARLGLSLERLLAGLDVIGVERETALAIVEKVALDSVPPIRRKAYEALQDGPQKTREVASTLNLPTTTVRRALEDITAHGLATRQRAKNDTGKDGRDDEWTRIELHISAAPVEWSSPDMRPGPDG